MQDYNITILQLQDYPLAFKEIINDPLSGRLWTVYIFFGQIRRKSFHAWLAFGEPRLAKSEPVYLKQWATKKNHFQHKQENSHLQIATEKEKTTEHG